MIDIIIPVYNASSTLPRTLMSILIQECSCPYQVTLVDDCSDDDYSSIIKDFENYFPINYYRMDKNGGSGVAREKGIQITNGEFLTFIDADDLFFDVDSLEKLYQTIKKGKYDIVSGSEIDEDRSTFFINEGDLHGKLYRRSYIIDNNIHFNETRFHEDNYFNSLVLLSGAKNYKLFEIVYIYCYNPNSITKNQQELQFKRLEILLSNVRELLEKIPLTKNNVELISHFIFIKYKYYNRIYHQEFTKKQQEIFRNWILEYDPEHIDFLGITNPDELEKKIKDYYQKKNL